MSENVLPRIPANHCAKLALQSGWSAAKSLSRFRVMTCIVGRMSRGLADGNHVLGLASGPDGKPSGGLLLGGKLPVVLEEHLRAVPGPERLLCLRPFRDALGQQ